MHEPSPAEDFTHPPDPRQRFGEDVRRVRQGRRLTQRQLAKATGYSESYISQVESGTITSSAKFAEGCDLCFGTNGLFTDLLKRLGAGHAAWFFPYLALERRALRILNYSGHLVTGLLQTEQYVRAVYRAAHSRKSAEWIEDAVSARLARRAAFERPDPPEQWVILHEACLRTEVGGREVMAEQLEFLLTAASSPQVDLQVVPFSAGAAAKHLMSYTLLTFGDRPSALYADTPTGGVLVDTDETVSWGFDNFDLLRANALSLTQSRHLISDLLKEFRS